MRKIILCCNKKGCPQVNEIEKSKFKITDDYGGEVILTEEEIDLLVKEWKCKNTRKLDS